MFMKRLKWPFASIWLTSDNFQTVIMEASQSSTGIRAPQQRTWLQYFGLTRRDNHPASSTSPAKATSTGAQDPQSHQLSNSTPSSNPEAKSTLGHSISNTVSVSTASTSDESLDTLSSRYNKYIIGSASAVAFGSMLYTIRQQTKGVLLVYE